MDSNSIRAEIDAWRTTSAQAAETLYTQCIRGEISYTEAWNRLPGPAPNVYYPHQSTNAHIPEVDYQHLTRQQANRMFHGKEEERKQEEFRMQTQLEVLRKAETDKPTELERDIEAARKEYDMRQAYVLRMQTKVQELEEQLVRWRRELANEQTEYTAAKATKERLESSKEEILANLKQTRKEAEDEYNATRTAWHTVAQTSKERQERDKMHIQMLYSRLAQAEKDAKEYEAKVAAEKHAEALRRLKQEKEQQDLERRIEEEVQRRKENAEFERLVALRMKQFRMKQCSFE